MTNDEIRNEAESIKLKSDRLLDKCGTKLTGTLVSVEFLKRVSDLCDELLEEDNN